MPTNLGSGLWAQQHAAIPHLAVSNEMANVRADIAKVLTPLAALAVEEFTNPVASDPAGLLVATTTSVAIQQKLAAALLAPGKAALAAFPRNITFTTGAGTSADAPANAVIVGTDVDDKPLTETVVLAQTNTIAEGVKAFKTIVSITYAAGDGAGTTVSIGFGKKFGLRRPIKVRAGAKALLREISGGAVVTAPADMVVDEFTAPALAVANGLFAATATSVAVQTILTAALLAGGKAALAAYPRNVTFTTSGVTPSDAPATATITGTDVNGAALVEVVNVAQTGTIAKGVKAFSTITSIVYSAGDGAGALVAVGFGDLLGLSHPIKFRGGYTGPIKELNNGAVVTSGAFVAAATGLPNGTYDPAGHADGSTNFVVYYESAASASAAVVDPSVSAPYGTYAPTSDPDGVKDYTIYYEYDASLTTDG